MPEFDLPNERSSSDTRQKNAAMSQEQDLPLIKCFLREQEMHSRGSSKTELSSFVIAGGVTGAVAESLKLQSDKALLNMHASGFMDVPNLASLKPSSSPPLNHIVGLHDTYRELDRQVIKSLDVIDIAEESLRGVRRQVFSHGQELASRGKLASFVRSGEWISPGKLELATGEALEVANGSKLLLRGSSLEVAMKNLAHQRWNPPPFAERAQLWSKILSSAQSLEQDVHTGKFLHSGEWQGRPLKTIVGTTEEVANRSRFIVSGGAEHRVVQAFYDQEALLIKSQRDFLKVVEKASTAEVALATATSQLSSRTATGAALKGLGKGVLISGATIGAGMAVDGMLSRALGTESQQNSSKLLLDGLATPGILLSRLPIQHKLTLAAVSFATARAVDYFSSSSTSAVSPVFRGNAVDVTGTKANNIPRQLNRFE